MDNHRLISKIFDGVSKHYDRFLKSATLGKITKWQSELIENTDIKDVCIDVGTGTGEILRLLPENSQKIGIDLSLQMLKVAKEKLKNKKNTFFIKCSALYLPFKNSSVSNIFYSLVFRHLENEKALKEAKRVLRQNGQISILDVGKPNSKLLFKFILFFSDKLFRPIGRLIYSKEEYDYFIDSIKEAKSIEELNNFFENNGFKTIYNKKYLFGMIYLAAYEKV